MLGAENLAPLSRWVAVCSWSFCKCGRMRPLAGLSDWQVPQLRAVLVPCTSKRNYIGLCSRPITDFVMPVSSQDDAVYDAVPMQTQEAYVCPRKTDWPVYDPILGEYVTCTGPEDPRESMLELSEEEAASLQLAEAYVDFRRTGTCDLHTSRVQPLLVPRESEPAAGHDEV